MKSHKQWLLYFLHNFFLMKNKLEMGGGRFEVLFKMVFNNTVYGNKTFWVKITTSDLGAVKSDIIIVNSQGLVHFYIFRKKIAKGMGSWVFIFKKNWVGRIILSSKKN